MNDRIYSLLRWGARLTGVAVLFVVAVVVAALLWPLPDRLERRDSVVVEYHDGEAAHVFLSADDKWRIDPSLDRIDPAYVEALVALEDERFWFHPGVDPIAVVRAAASNARHGEVVSGASTVTMQLVRILEPRPRTLRSKLIEAFKAVQLELRFSKREILEHYLRFAPYGRNVEGVPAASYAYFGHAPDELSPSEIVTLLAVPQNPAAHAPTDGPPEDLDRARNRVVDALLDADAVPGTDRADEERVSEVAERIRAARLPDAFEPFPREIPHAAYWLRARHPDAERIETTVDAGVQKRVDRYIETYQRRSERRDIHNSAAVVLEHESGAVRGVAGNFEFFVDADAGQIPGFDVPRSTGSLLKPFLYAQAIDERVAGPRHLVRDTPVRYGEYRPENYNGTFSGLVRLEEALAQSLNVPFVNLASDVGVDSFLGRLRHMGAAHLREDPGYYGLNVAVGGAALTPLEVAGAYATLARGGTPAPVRMTPEAAITDPVEERLFSRGSTWLTRRALARRDRPDFPNRSQFTGSPPTVSWKTGTSAGKRDAWTAGFGPNYTVVVWMGNFDNASSPSLVGSEAAAPLFFDLVEAIDDPPDALPRPPSSAMTEVDVCAYSGHLPGDACPETERALLPTRHVPTEECPFHIRAAVDTETGRALDPSCRDTRESKQKTFVVWPSGVRRWMTDRGASVPRMPEYADGCRPRTSHRPPEIVSPPRDADLVLVPGLPAGEQQVPLAADADSNSEVSWFVDGEFVGSAPSDRRIWWTPEEGTHELKVMDAHGETASREFTVR